MVGGEARVWEGRSSTRGRLNCLRLRFSKMKLLVEIRADIREGVELAKMP